MTAGFTFRDMSDHAGIRWYRRGATRLLGAAIVSALSVPSLVLIVFGIGSPASPARITAGAVMLAAVAVWVRLLLRAGIGVTPECVLVRRATGRTKTIPWPQVTGIEVRIGSKKDVTIFVLASGGKRWHTMGCSFTHYSPWETWELQRALEDEHLAWVPGSADTLYPRPPGSEEATPAWAWIILGLITVSWLFVLAGFPLYTGITSLGPELRASHGAGTAGYFVPRQKSCPPRAECRWDGEFRVPGGRVTRGRVRLVDVAANSIRAGVSVAARDTGADGIVFPRNDLGAWHDAAIGIVIGAWASAVFLVTAIGLGIRWLHPGHRRGNVAAAP